ncbi:hypothetical protein DEAC_c18310 [Desulfosporosinus acididurans]|uniref:Glycoside-hydrolase family GH114 TIM-barrel domain-containing protein n=1 Tax=Desulfosporosinus acididurans TaxID=476652 RepID=A0A0J1FT04_9FIRM|nr:endo alpha-1,4 polygalactosaminidase [Desulfosporosinus acididurans]KLU66432.1 hypothetical protein DEAC_c18310 [Desulfosporosinus acididurans]
MNKKARFTLANNYALYYGRGKVNQLTQFDIAIVEPTAHSYSSLLKMKSFDTLTLAYLSVMEVSLWSEDLMRLGFGDMLHIDGKPYISQEFGNYWIDLRSSRWKRLLLDKVEYLLVDQRYDGIFLDTVGNVESDHFSDKMKTELVSAATSILRKIRKKFPSCLLIQNCGLEILFKKTAKYLDGICWENPPFHLPTSRDWISQVMDLLIKEKQKHNLKVFILVEEKNPCANYFDIVKKMAFDNQFLVYFASSFYNTDVLEAR